jgi:hypothetical protein
MDEQITWLVKLILAHLLTDFILQPSRWIESRRKGHFASGALYWHCLVTALVAWLLIGLRYWPVMLVIFVTHLLIDGWKSYQKDTVGYFLADQALHLFVIFCCWYVVFLHPSDINAAWQSINHKKNWILFTAVVFVSQPASIVIGQLTKKWRAQIPNGDGLGNAGKWIGVIERIIILALVIHHQYALVGLLLTAKGLLRFNEPNRLEVKTEYLLIGTLLSFGTAVLTGVIVIKLIGG